MTWSTTASTQTKTAVDAAKTRRHLSQKVANLDATNKAVKPAKPAPPKQDFQTFVKRQAALEVQLGLTFYRAQDDYRAITAMRRYQALSGTPDASFLSSLIIGQIYHRNKKHEQAAFSFEQSVRNAPSTQAKVWSYLMIVQELCLPLSYYYACRNRLNDVLQVEQISPAQRELIDYQKLYVDVVLRSPYVTKQRTQMFADPVLQKRAQGLIKRNEEFNNLDLQTPWLAGTLSAILPGAGQFYNGRYLDGGIAFGVNALLGGATYYAFAKADSVPLGIVSSIFLASFYVGNIVNAYTDAKRINAQTYLAFFDKLKIDYWPRVKFNIQNNDVEFGYSFDWPGPKPGQRAKPSKNDKNKKPPTKQQPKDNML